MKQTELCKYGLNDCIGNKIIACAEKILLAELSAKKEVVSNEDLIKFSEQQINYLHFTVCLMEAMALQRDDFVGKLKMV